MAAVDRSLSLLGGDVFCLAAAGRCTPTVDPSGMGKVQGPTLREGARQGLVGSNTSARAKFPSLRPQASKQIHTAEVRGSYRNTVLGDMFGSQFKLASHGC